jgi:hypothetical protein
MMLIREQERGGAPGQRFEAYERNVSRIVARRLGGVEGPRLAATAASWASNSEAS